MTGLSREGENGNWHIDGYGPGPLSTRAIFFWGIIGVNGKVPYGL